MDLTQDEHDQLKMALQAYMDKQKAAGEPEPKDIAEFLTTIKHLRGFTASVSDTIKIKLAYNLAGLAEREKQQEIMAWVKGDTTLRGKELSDIFAQDRSGSAFYFIHDLSKDTYDLHARSFPVYYLNARKDLRSAGIDTSYEPSQPDTEAHLGKIDPAKLDVRDLTHAKDPASIQRIVTAVIDEDNKGPMMAERNASIILREYVDKVLSVPNGKALLNKSILASAGIDMDGQGPLPPGSLKPDMREVKFLSKALAGKVDIQAGLMRGLQRDPMAALVYAGENYPKDPSALNVYLSALPRAAELLESPTHSKAIIRMLNVLEPSQYAGESYRLVPEKEVFKLLEKARPEQIFDLITQRISNNTYEFTHGTYNAMLDDMFRKMKSEGKSLTDIVNSSADRPERLRTFLEAAAVYNRMADVVRTTSPAEHEHFAGVLLHKQKDANLDLGTTSEFIKALPKNSPVLPFIESSLMLRGLEGSEYDKADVGMMSYWYANNSGHVPSADNKAFFDKVSRDETFQVKPLDKIPASAMLDAAKRNYQLHVFYNDTDGIDTFKSFSASMKADGWATKKQDDFLIFSKERDGRRVEMLVSPPESNGEAVGAIKDYVAQKNGKISVLIGRGHSHHMSEAVDLITKDTKLVTLGGCWGHNYVSQVIEKSPEAHILSTSGIGRMAINNATTRWINDQILGGRDLDWQQLQRFWDTLAKDKTLAKDAALYVAPDKNIMLNFERRRSELYEEIENAGEPEAGKASKLKSTFMQSMRGSSPVISENAPERKAREISRAPSLQTSDFVA